MSRHPAGRETARPLRGARRFACALGLLAPLSLVTPANAVERLEGPPPWRIGGRTGFTCDVASFPDSSGYHLEVYVRIPPATLEHLARGVDGQ